MFNGVFEKLSASIFSDWRLSKDDFLTLLFFAFSKETRVDKKFLVEKGVETQCLKIYPKSLTPVHL